MKSQTLFGGIVLCGILAVNVLVSAQDKKDPNRDAKKPEPVKPDDKKPAGQPELPPEMAAWLQFAAPDEHHKNLDVLAGQWNQVVKCQMAPQAPVQECKGTTNYHWILGGRFLVQEVKGEMLGQPFEGFALHGYDRQKQKYVSVWADSMGTMFMTSEGTSDASGKVITYISEFDCPLAKSRKKMKSVLKIENKDKVIFEMYDVESDGKEFKGMEIVATRAGNS